MKKRQEPPYPPTHNSLPKRVYKYFTVKKTTKKLMPRPNCFVDKVK
jgi:hypothetical protein